MMLSYRQSDIFKRLKERDKPVVFTVNLHFRDHKMWFDGLVTDPDLLDDNGLTKMKALEDVIYDWEGAKRQGNKLYYDAGASGAGVSDILFDLRDHIMAYNRDFEVSNVPPNVDSPDMTYKFDVTAL